MINRLLHMLGLGRVTLVDETGPMAIAQVEQTPLGADHPLVLDQLKRWTQFGDASVPPLGSEVLLVALGGLRGQTMVIASNHQPTRPRNMKPGDRRIYDVRGAMIDFSEAGMVIDAAGLPVTIRNYSTLTAQGDLHVTGDVISRSGGTPVSLNGLRDAYAAHKHGGVQAGGASTSTTDHPA